MLKHRTNMSYLVNTNTGHECSAHQFNFVNLFIGITFFFSGITCHLKRGSLPSYLITPSPIPQKLSQNTKA